MLFTDTGKIERSGKQDDHHGTPHGPTGHGPTAPHSPIKLVCSRQTAKFQSSPNNQFSKSKSHPCPQSPQVKSKSRQVFLYQ